MNPDQFWTSQDGQILTVKNKDERTVTLILGFWPRHPAEFEFLKSHLAALKFTERSSMARIGIEMLTQGHPQVEGNRLELEVDAFIYDSSFPNASYWKKLMRVGSPVGRLFYAPTLTAADNLFRGVVAALYEPNPRGMTGTPKAPWLERLREDGCS